MGSPTTSLPAGAERPSRPIRLHRMALSGHCHRVELLLSLLGLPYELVDVDSASRAHKSPEFLAKNAFGQVPVIEDGEVTLADSNAILVYLEARYAPGRWMPRDPVQASAVQRWLSVAAGQLTYGPHLARAINLFKRPGEPVRLLHGPRPCSELWKANSWRGRFWLVRWPHLPTWRTTPMSPSHRRAQCR